MSRVVKLRHLLIAALLVIAGIWWCRLGSDDIPVDVSAGLAADGLSPAETRPPLGNAVDMEVVVVRDPASSSPEVDVETGAVKVSVAYDNGPVAIGVGVRLIPRGKRRSDCKWARTNMQGDVEFKDVEGGQVMITIDRAPISDRSVVQVKIRDIAHVKLIIASHLHISGIVVSDAGIPVPDAEILLYDERLVDETALPLTKTDDSGRFTVVTAFRSCWIGARARGWGSSVLQRLIKIPGTTGDHDLIIRLQPGGELVGCLTGIGGVPVPNGAIRVGNNDVDSVSAHGDTAAPLATLAHSGMDGTFVVIGVPAGEHPVHVRASGYAPWSGTCVVREAATTRLDVELLAESRIVGVVKTASGAPCSDALVSTGRQGSVSWVSAVTSQDGRFALGPLAPGVVEVSAVGAQGSVRADVEVGVGQERDVVLTLRQTDQVSGRVTVDDGSSLAGARVEVRASGRFFVAWTDSDGSFHVNNLAPGEGVVTVSHRDVVDLRQNIDIPSSLNLCVSRKPPGDAVVRGRVTMLDGSVVPGADVGIMCISAPLHSESVISDVSGAFECSNLHAGTYRIRVSKGNLPIVMVGDRMVEKGAEWMVGDIVLVKGGTIRVDAPAPSGSEMQVSVYYPGYRHAAYVKTMSRSVVTEPLLPGECDVFIAGKSIGSEHHKVEVVAGRETSVSARLERGFHQSVVVDFVSGKAPSENGDPAERWVLSYVRRNGAIVTFKSGAWRGGRCNLSYCLVPGVYEVELTSGGRSMIVPLTVDGITDAAPLRVDW